MQGRSQAELMLKDIREDDELDLREINVDEHATFRRHETTTNRRRLAIVFEQVGFLGQTLQVEPITAVCSPGGRQVAKSSVEPRTIHLRQIGGN